MKGVPMCDIRLLRSAFMDFLAAKQIYTNPYNDEMYLNNSAYHLQQAVEKTLKGSLECIGVTVPNTHKITRLLSMIRNYGANLIITEWLDDHSEMLSSWEVETRYNMDFLVEKRKLDRAITEVENFLRLNGICEELRVELKDPKKRAALLLRLPAEKRDCSFFELNCYYLMFQKDLEY